MESNFERELVSMTGKGLEIKFEVFTLFPGVFEPYLGSSILERARQRGLMEVRCHNIRDWTEDRHRTTDDEPYGGGGGMVLKPEPVFAAVEDVLGSPPSCPVILLTPQGRQFNQGIARELVERVLFNWANRHEQGERCRVGLVCGRYEGVDERIRAHLVSDEISIGDYVLTGGELAAMVVIDAITRLIPGVLGDAGALEDDSHASGLLEYPHYTRPAEYRGWKVPDVLISGDHARIEKWRREQALLRTLKRRPDLLEKANLNKDDLEYLAGVDSIESA